MTTASQTTERQENSGIAGMENGNSRITRVGSYGNNGIDGIHGVGQGLSLPVFVILRAGTSPPYLRLFRCSLFVAQRDQWINAGRAPCGHIAGKDRYSGEQHRYSHIGGRIGRTDIP